MIIVVDTSALVDSLTGPRRSGPLLRQLVEAGERMVLPTLVLYEWWRGPRTTEELNVQEMLFPEDQALPFGAAESETAARLYGEVKRPRGRELDLAIAAHAITREAALWTYNVGDFQDIPELALVEADFG